MNLPKVISVIVMDILLLAEVAASVYLAHKTPEVFTPVFLKSFLIMVIPTLVSAKFIIRKCEAKGASISL
jgi:hypothetical protein